jgi:hypothetical protein
VWRKESGLLDVVENIEQLSAVESKTFLSLEF